MGLLYSYSFWGRSQVLSKGLCAAIGPTRQLTTEVPTWGAHVTQRLIVSHTTRDGGNFLIEIVDKKQAGRDRIFK